MLELTQAEAQVGEWYEFWGDGDGHASWRFLIITD